MDVKKNLLLKPLVVDLDGTLLKSDILWESFFVFIKSMPWRFYFPLLWLCLGGKSFLKTRLAQHTNISIEHLPFDVKIINWLQMAKAAGRKLILATASHEKYAHKISEYLGLFDEVIATNQHLNLSGESKRDVLVNRFGTKGYDYLGNSMEDLKVWETANCAFLVNPIAKVEGYAKRIGNVREVFRTNTSSGRLWLKAMRIHQWLKNLLLFVPLFAAHQITSVTMLANGFFAFIIFGCCASSVYLLNDILDLDDDRRHVNKKNRPFASGALPIQSALFVIPLLLLLSLTAAYLLLPFEFFIILCLYYLTTLGYMLQFKRIMMLDVVILAGLYTLRIIAGIATFQLQPTFWMLAFSMFIFMSLALVKRYAELIQVRNTKGGLKAHGRGYYSNDLEIIASLGAAAGYLSVLVLAFYIQDNTTTLLYRYPKILWLSCPFIC